MNAALTTRVRACLHRLAIPRESPRWWPSRSRYPSSAGPCARSWTRIITEHDRQQNQPAKPTTTTKTKTA